MYRVEGLRWILFGFPEECKAIRADENGQNDWKTIELDKTECALMQFTGLLDCNGKEIYEGDIVKWKYELRHDYDGYADVEIDTDYTGIIELSLQTGVWTRIISKKGNILKSEVTDEYFEKTYKGMMIMPSNRRKKFKRYIKYKVIGNIYENPNLLSEKEEPIKCVPDDPIYTSNPPQYKCKYCGKFWHTNEQIPMCNRKEEPIRVLIETSDKPLDPRGMSYTSSYDGTIRIEDKEEEELKEKLSNIDLVLAMLQSVKDANDKRVHNMAKYAREELSGLSDFIEQEISKARQEGKIEGLQEVLDLGDSLCYSDHGCMAFDSDRVMQIRDKIRKDLSLSPKEK